MQVAQEHQADWLTELLCGRNLEWLAHLAMVVKVGIDEQRRHQSHHQCRAAPTAIEQRRGNHADQPQHIEHDEKHDKIKQYDNRRRTHRIHHSGEGHGNGIEAYGEIDQQYAKSSNQKRHNDGSQPVTNRQ